MNASAQCLQMSHCLSSLCRLFYSHLKLNELICQAEIPALVVTVSRFGLFEF